MTGLARLPTIREAIPADRTPAAATPAAQRCEGAELPRALEMQSCAGRIGRQGRPDDASVVKQGGRD